MTIPTLAEALETTLTTKGLKHLTLAPTHDGKWQASFQASAHSGYSVAISISAHLALIGALTGDNNPDYTDDDDADLLG